jgi:solute carrier family 25 (adenine nucleotide translocator) protein 4/5/6/31
MAASRNNNGFLVSFLIEGLSAAFSKTASAPLERVKLLFQMQEDLLQTGRLDGKYVGTFDCIERVIRREGFLGLFRGNMLNVIRFFPVQLLNLAFRDEFKKLFSYQDPRVGYGKRLLGNIVSGGLVGSVSLIVAYPIDYAHTRLACDIPDASGKYQFSGPLDVILQTVENDGILGLYRGFLLSNIGIFAYRGLYFLLYDLLRPFFPHNNNVTSFLLGWGVTIAAGLLTYPIDTVRRKMMLHYSTESGYRNTWSTTLMIWHTEGIFGFWNGAGTNIWRAVLSAAALALFDNLSGHFKK